MIVADYIEHLVEMQKQITKTADEHQDRYVKRRVKLVFHEELGLMGGLGRMAAGGRQTS
jgi:hypothetical protein